METFNPGYCTIEQAILKSYKGDTENIAGMIPHFSMSASIGQVAISGEIEVLDGVNLLNKLPIRGEEELNIVLKCHDLQTEVELNLQVIEVADLIQQTSSGDTYKYTLKFITKSSYKAGIQNIITAFRNKKASYAANQLFKKYFKPNLESSRKFNIEESDGVMRLVIPDYTPQEAMNFLCRKAFTKSSKSSTYRFFETIDGYNFVTDEWLLAEAQKKEIKNLKYTPIVDRNPLEGKVIIETLEDFKNSAHVNTFNDMRAGAYKNTVMEIDLTTHKKRVFNYDYLEKKGSYKGMQGQVGGISGSKHSDDFIKETFTYDNAPQNIVYRDWSPEGFEAKDRMVPREDQHMTEIIQNRIAYHYHMMENMCTAVIRGRIDLKPGEVVNLSILESNASLEAEQNKRLSGYYLIYAVGNNINGESLETALKLVKYDWETEV